MDEAGKKPGAVRALLKWAGICAGCGLLAVFLAEAVRPKEPGVHVLRLEGVVGDELRLDDKLRKRIDRAFEGAPLMVALVVDSPGGSPSQSELIHNYIRHKADRSGTETVTFIEDVGASGGYYIALAGSRILVDRQSMVGSIGVVSAGFNFKELADRFGVQRWVVAQGKNKHRLDPFTPMSEADRDWVAGIQTASFDVFKAHVTERRKAMGREIPAEEHDKLFNGDVWIGEQAVAAGLADGLGEAYVYAASRFPAAPVREIEDKRDAIDKLADKFAAASVEAVLRAVRGSAVPLF